MPVVEAHILEGYTPEEKSRLAMALTKAVRFVISGPGDGVTVLLHELEHQAYARGGQHRLPAPMRPDPTAIVLDYLGAMERRELDAASGMLGVGFEMRFPGTDAMTRLGELLEWSRDRYAFVAKTIEGVEALPDGARSVVYVRGTLSGEWTDGTPFEGIRFIDRFELEDGLITRQDVWNDIAEVRAA